MSNEAITVTNEVTLDHYQLGKAFAGWDNRQQATFLYGVSRGLDKLGGAFGIQLLSIMDAARDQGIDMEVQDLAEQLHEYFKDSAA